MTDEPPESDGPPVSPGDRIARLSAIRADLRRRRRDLSGPVRSAATVAIADHLLSLPTLDRPTSDRRHGIALHRAVDGEVDLAPVAPELRRRGWVTYLPVAGPRSSMRFAQWDEGETLVEGRFGIPIPATPRTTVDADVLAMVVVPAVAVDIDGNRIGFGVGYYDRALTRRAPSTTLVAAVFGFQVIEAIDPQPWDVPMDVIVTEDGVRVTDV